MRFKDWPTRGETLGVLFGGGTLLGVLWLMASRFSSDRLKPVAAFLVVSTVGFLGYAMAGLALLTPAETQREGDFSTAAGNRSRPSTVWERM